MGIKHPDAPTWSVRSEAVTRARRVVSVAFVALGLPFALLALYALLRIARHTAVVTPVVVVVYIALPAALAIVFWAAARGSTAFKASLLTCCVLVGLALVWAEADQRTADPLRWLTRRAERAAKLAHRPFDGRSALEVLDSLRATGRRAYPSLYGYAIRKGQERGVPLTFQLSGSAVLPLAGISDADNIYCNESGRWSLLHSDERGFNNPLGLWRPDSLQVALVGDSFAFGACVPADSNVAAWIRQRFPRTLNLGVGGSGPLSMLARLREFLPPLRPRAVLWLFTEGNDLDDLWEEKANAILDSYLDTGYQQGLTERQPDIDRHLELFFAGIADSARAVSERRRFRHLRLRDLLTLEDVRRALRVPSLHSGKPDEVRYWAFERYDYALLHRTLDEARRTVTSWGGRLYFVVIPDNSHFVTSAGTYCRPCRPGAYLDSLNAARHRGVAVAREVGLPVIDLHETLQSQMRYERVFAFPGSHLSAEGYRVIAAAILAAMSEEGGIGALGLRP